MYSLTGIFMGMNSRVLTRSAKSMKPKVVEVKRKRKVWK